MFPSIWVPNTKIERYSCMPAGPIVRRRGVSPGASLATYDSVILAESNLTAYWPLNESSGTTATDNKGTNNCTNSGTVTVGAASLLSQDTETSFNYGGGWSAMASNASPSSGAFTVECWANLASSNGNLRGIITTGTFNTNGWLLYISGSGNLRFYTQGGTDNDTGFAPTVGSTYYYVVTYDGTKITVYANNSQKLQVTQGYTASNAAGYIGSWGTGANRWWNGKIQKVALYNSPLSAARMTAHYAYA
jgi:hypothetical protein